MKQVVIENSIINAEFYPRQVLNKPLSIISKLRPLTFGFVLAVILCNYQQAMTTTGYAYGQTPNPQTLPPGRLENIPVTPLPSDVLPQPSNQDQLLPPPQLPEQQTPRQDYPDAIFQVNRIEVIGSTVFKPEQFAAITAPFVGREVSFAELLQVKDAIAKLYTDNGYVTQYCSQKNSIKRGLM